MTIFIKEDIIRLFRARDLIEHEIRQDGLTSSDFSNDEWVEMILEKMESNEFNMVDEL